MIYKNVRGCLNYILDKTSKQNGESIGRRLENPDEYTSTHMNRNTEKKLFYMF